MKSALQRRQADPQDRGGLVAGKLLQITEYEDLPVVGREGVKRPGHGGVPLAPHGCLFRIVAPPASRETQRIERHAVDRGRLAGMATRLSEHRMPGDCEQPRADRRLTSEGRRRAPRGEKSLLKGVLARGRIRREGADEPVYGTRMPRDQLFERGLIAKAGLFQYRRIV